MSCCPGFCEQMFLRKLIASKLVSYYVAYNYVNFLELVIYHAERF